MLFLSVIDDESPLLVARMVPVLDALGYRRFWATEHHHHQRSASPTILAGIAAATSSNIRVGTAGVMLSYQSPLRIAEDFHLLEALFPGRVDLGIVSTVESAESAHAALMDGRPEGVCSYATRAQMLAMHLRGGALTDGIQTIRARTVPALWVCGLSTDSAQLAGQLGAGFAFSVFFAQMRHGPDARMVFARYCESFQPNLGFRTPTSLVACCGVCAESASQAESIWKRRVGGILADPRAATDARPTFLGTPQECADQLHDVASRCDVTELAVMILADGLTAKVEAYTMLAEACRV